MLCQRMARRQLYLDEQHYTRCLRDTWSLLDERLDAPAAQSRGIFDNNQPHRTGRRLLAREGEQRVGVG